MQKNNSQIKEIKEIKEKEQWHNQADFMQAWDYGSFLQSLGRDVVRLSIEKDERMILQVQGVVFKIKPGIKYAYFPRADISTDKIRPLIQYFKEKKFDFLRIEPVNELDLAGSNDVIMVTNRQTPYTLVLGLSHDEQDLLDKMHSKTRYNIKLAERKGVKINQEKDINLFWNLYKTTTERNKFRIHPKSFFEQLLKKDFVYQVNAYYKDEPLSAAILVKNLDTISYFFGASADKQRNLMAPYLMHWHIILLGKKLGCNKYDLFGMAKPAQKTDRNAVCFHNICWDGSHPFSSVTRFKAGFGAVPRQYGQAVDIIIRPNKYKLYNIIMKLKGNPVPVGHSNTAKTQISF